MIKINVSEAVLVNSFASFGWFVRSLAYVYLKDDGKEVFVNEYLLKEGAAIFFLDTVNLKYQERLIEVAEKAHREKKGIEL